VRLAPVKHDARQHRSAAKEHQALADALGASQEDLSLLAREAGDAEAEAILAFQIALLEDDSLAAPAFTGIANGEAAHRAWSAAIDPEIASYEAAEDPYFRGRASDLRDLRDRVLRHLAGKADQIVPAGVILAADDMPPSTFLATDWRDGGLVLRRGSPSSHVAILARSRPGVLRIWSARLLQGIRPDLLVAPVHLVGEGGTAARLLRAEPATMPLVRDVTLSGRPTENALTTLADARPVECELDPGWDRRIVSHLVADRMWLRFAPQPLGASDRRLAFAAAELPFARVLAMSRADDAFDPAVVADRSTFSSPNQLAEGMRWVLVNGVPVIADGQMTGAKPGQVLRGPGYRRAQPKLAQPK